MDTMEKLEILAEAAKYDVACTSSGVERAGEAGKLGAVLRRGVCHSFSADGRCITLLKLLLTNACVYDCAYCVNRRSNDVPRTMFTPRELAGLTMGFYRRNYIEGLFISSGVAKSADYTMELIVETARVLREDEGFAGYIHAKAIPGASPELLSRLGRLVDRVSVNVELPSQGSLDLLAPEKARTSVVEPMRLICDGIAQSAQDRRLARRNHLSRALPPQFAPAGQSTQMVIGASPETDHHILRLTERFYRSFGLKRVFYSAYLPVNDDARLPSPASEIPLSREHRLYQADWLLRYYGFEVDELLSPRQPDLDLLVDPKAAWALRNMDAFPLEVNKASYEELLRVPGVGVKCAKRIMRARRYGRLSFDELKRLGLSFKRAGFFLLCNGRMAPGFAADPLAARAAMEQSTLASGAGRKRLRKQAAGQLSLFEGCQDARDKFAARPARACGLPAPSGGPELAGRRDVRRLAAEDAPHSRGGLCHAATPSGLPATDPLLDTGRRRA